MTDTTSPTALDLLKRAEALLSALHGSVARHDNLAANLGCAGCELRDQISAALPSLAVAPAVLPPAADRTAVLREAADAITAVIERDRAYSPRRSNDRAALGGAREIVLGLIDQPGRLAAGEQQAETKAEDPARIVRLRPEFFEHASVEAIDSQIRRAQTQQRQWGNRVQTLAILRQARVKQKELGEWPAVVAEPGKEN